MTCISAMSVGGLLPGKMSNPTEATEEAMEALAPILETMVAEKQLESSTPVPKVVGIEE